MSEVWNEIFYELLICRTDVNMVMAVEMKHIEMSNCNISRDLAKQKEQICKGNSISNLKLHTFHPSASVPEQ